MNTVANARAEKNLQDAREARQSEERYNMDMQRIEHFENVIKQEKKAVAQCLELGYYNMAKTKIENIEGATEKIIKIKLNWRI